MKRFIVLTALILALSLLFGCDRADAPLPSAEGQTPTSLIPNGDYGMLYPFIGWIDEDIRETFAEGNYELEHDITNVFRYGLVDANGEIVVEPIYYGVEPIRHDYYSSGDQIEMWKLYIEPLTDPHMSQSAQFILATFDGTTVTEQSYFSASAYEEYVIAYFYDENNEYSAHVYDASGKLCLDFSDWGFEDAILRDYGCGVFGVQVSIEEMYYCDWDGNVIAGPFEYIDCFSSGYGLAMLSENCYAYFDAEGNKLLDRDFYFAENFTDGYAVVSLGEHEQALLSATDGIIFTCEGYHGQVESGLVNIWDDGDVFYNFSGEKLFEAEAFESYDVLNDKLIFDYESGIVINLENGKEFFSEKFNHYYWYDSPASVNYYIADLVGDDLVYTSYVIDEDFNLLYETDGFFDHEIDRMTQIGYYRNSTTLYGTQVEFDFVGGFDRVFDGRVFCYDENGSYQYDLSGNLLFSYLFDTTAE